MAPRAYLERRAAPRAALLLQPRVVFAAFGRVETRHQLAVVQLERGLERALAARLLERRRVAPQMVRAHGQLVAARDHPRVAERAAQHVQRLPEGRPRVRLVQIGQSRPTSRSRLWNRPEGESAR
jgi:hypothetical protein